MTQLFSIVAMFIMMRETLEACIVVAVMLNLCKKLNLMRAVRQVWFGVALGVTIAVLIGVIFIIIFYVAKNTVFSGAGKNIFKGYVNLLASFLIALLGFAMLRFMNYEKKWEVKLARMKAESDRKQKASGKSTNWAIFLLCFTAVLREGIEAVVFLAGVSTTESVTAIPIAAVVGVLCGLAIGFLLFYTGREIKDLWWFFLLSFIFLFLIGAGLVSTGVSSWQSIGWFGTFFPTVNRPWWNQAVWDTCGCCNDNIANNKFFGLINAIFGYQCQPTFISLFSYCMFWIIIFGIVAIKAWRGSLTDAFYKMKKAENKRRKALGLPRMNKQEEQDFVNNSLDQRFQEAAGGKEGKGSEEGRSSDDLPSTSRSDSDELDKKSLKKVSPDPEDPYNINAAKLEDPYGVNASKIDSEDFYKPTSAVHANPAYDEYSKEVELNDRSDVKVEFSKDA